MMANGEVPLNSWWRQSQRLWTSSNTKVRTLRFWAALDCPQKNMNTKATGGVHTFLITHRECMVTKPVILDVVQYEGVKPLDKGAIEKLARMSGVTDWKCWRGSTTSTSTCTSTTSHRLETLEGKYNKGTNRAENLLTTLFWQCEPCWELNYSKESLANLWILFTHSIRPH